MKIKFVILLAILALSFGWLLSAFTSKQQFIEMKEIMPETIQETQSSPNRYVRVFDVTLDAQTQYNQIDFGFTYSSFIIELLDHQIVKYVRYKTNEGETSILNGSSNADLDDNRRLTTFVIPFTEQETMNLYSGSISGKIRIYLFYAPRLEVESRTRLQKSHDSCSKPEMVLGATWREGLPAPTGTREPSTVQHNIVHHAASSNYNHDYMNVVRNIYLLHTQSNGWDDIGYNFLVAQDGSIFEGRDPLNTSDIDDTKGAHFCGKNSGTMGVCVLGNYMEISPTFKSMDALHHLLLWKCVKSGIDPDAMLSHPTSGSAKLNCVAGHRDGCATSCPGDSIYRLLPAMRAKLKTDWLACGGVAGVDDWKDQRPLFRVMTGENSFTILTNMGEWKMAEIYDLSGKKLSQHKYEANHLLGGKIPLPAPGRYVLKLKLKDNSEISTLFESQQ